MAIEITLTSDTEEIDCNVGEKVTFHLEIDNNTIEDISGYSIRQVADSFSLIILQNIGITSNASMYYDYWLQPIKDTEHHLELLDESKNVVATSDTLTFDCKELPPPEEKSIKITTFSASKTSNIDCVNGEEIEFSYKIENNGSVNIADEIKVYHNNTDITYALFGASKGSLDAGEFTSTKTRKVQIDNENPQILKAGYGTSGEEGLVTKTINMACKGESETKTIYVYPQFATLLPENKATKKGTEKLSRIIYSKYAIKFDDSDADTISFKATADGWENSNPFDINYHSDPETIISAKCKKLKVKNESGSKIDFEVLQKDTTDGKLAEGTLTDEQYKILPIGNTDVKNFEIKYRKEGETDWTTEILKGDKDCGSSKTEIFEITEEKITQEPPSPPPVPTDPKRRTFYINPFFVDDNLTGKAGTTSLSIKPGDKGIIKETGPIFKKEYYTWTDSTKFKISVSNQYYTDIEEEISNEDTINAIPEIKSDFSLLYLPVQTDEYGSSPNTPEWWIDPTSKISFTYIGCWKGNKECSEPNTSTDPPILWYYAIVPRNVEINYKITKSGYSPYIGTRTIKTDVGATPRVILYKADTEGIIKASPVDAKVEVNEVELNRWRITVEDGKAWAWFKYTYSSEYQEEGNTYKLEASACGTSESKDIKFILNTPQTIEVDCEKDGYCQLIVTVDPKEATITTKENSNGFKLSLSKLYEDEDKAYYYQLAPQGEYGISISASNHLTKEDTITLGSITPTEETEETTSCDTLKEYILDEIPTIWVTSEPEGCKEIWINKGQPDEQCAYHCDDTGTCASSGYLFTLDSLDPVTIEVQMACHEPWYYGGEEGATLSLTEINNDGIEVTKEFPIDIHAELNPWYSYLKITPTDMDAAIWIDKGTKDEWCQTRFGGEYCMAENVTPICFDNDEPHIITVQAEGYVDYALTINPGDPVIQEVPLQKYYSIETNKPTLKIETDPEDANLDIINITEGTKTTELSPFKGYVTPNSVYQINITKKPFYKDTTKYIYLKEKDVHEIYKLDEAYLYPLSFPHEDANIIIKTREGKEYTHIKNDEIIFLPAGTYTYEIETKCNEVFQGVISLKCFYDCANLPLTINPVLTPLNWKEKYSPSFCTVRDIRETVKDINNDKFITDYIITKKIIAAEDEIENILGFSLKHEKKFSESLRISKGYLKKVTTAFAILELLKISKDPFTEWDEWESIASAFTTDYFNASSRLKDERTKEDIKNIDHTKKATKNGNN